MMSRKKKMKDAVSLKAQQLAHEKLAQNGKNKVKHETKTFWRKEALTYQKQLEAIIEKAQFPPSYLKQIEEQARVKAEKGYLKKKKQLNQKRS